MADTIAQKTAVLVASVLTIRKLMLLAITPKLRAADMQQWANNITFQSAHPGQARQPASAEPVHHQRLHLIVGMVRNRNPRSANLTGNPSQERIACPPGSIFQRAMTLPRLGGDIRAAPGYRANPTALARSATKAASARLASPRNP